METIFSMSQYLNSLLIHSQNLKIRDYLKILFDFYGAIIKLILVYVVIGVSVSVKMATCQNEITNDYYCSLNESLLNPPVLLLGGCNPYFTDVNTLKQAPYNLSGDGQAIYFRDASERIPFNPSLFMYDNETDQCIYRVNDPYSPECLDPSDNLLWLEYIWDNQNCGSGNYMVNADNSNTKIIDESWPDYDPNNEKYKLVFSKFGGISTINFYIEIYNNCDFSIDLNQGYKVRVLSTNGTSNDILLSGVLLPDQRLVLATELRDPHYIPYPDLVIDSFISGYTETFRIIYEIDGEEIILDQFGGDDPSNLSAQRTYKLVDGELQTSNDFYTLPFSIDTDSNSVNESSSPTSNRSTMAGYGPIVRCMDPQQYLISKANIDNVNVTKKIVTSYSNTFKGLTQYFDCGQSQFNSQWLGLMMKEHDIPGTNLYIYSKNSHGLTNAMSGIGIGHGPAHQSIGFVKHGLSLCEELATPSYIMPQGYEIKIASNSVVSCGGPGSPCDDEDKYKAGLYSVSEVAEDNCLVSNFNSLAFYACGDNPSENDGVDNLGYPNITLKNGFVIGGMTSGQNGCSQSSLSSIGPTDDFRVKPDFVVPTLNPYAAGETSFASPTAAGMASLIRQEFRRLVSVSNPAPTIDENLKSSTLKALFVNTAHKALDLPVPHIRTGWGGINSLGTVKLLRDHFENLSLRRRIVEGNIIPNVTTKIRFSINIENNNENQGLKVALAWIDPAGPPRTDTEVRGFYKENGQWVADPTAPVLVNNLEMRIINTTNGEIYMPKRLNRLDPRNPPVVYDNNWDNVEFIDAGLVPNGNYYIEIGYEDDQIGGTQAYSLVLSGASIPIENGQLAVTELPCNDTMLLVFDDEWCLGEEIVLNAEFADNSTVLWQSWLLPDETVLNSNGNLLIENVDFSDAGEYEVIAMHENGCLVHSVFQVNVIDAVIPNFDYGDGTVCEGMPINLTLINGDQYLDYHWILPSGQEVYNAPVNISSAQTVHNGLYSLHLLNTNGCDQIIYFSIFVGDLEATVVSQLEGVLNFQPDVNNMQYIYVCGSDLLTISALAPPTVTNITWAGIGVTNPNTPYVRTVNTNDVSPNGNTIIITGMLGNQQIYFSFIIYRYTALLPQDFAIINSINQYCPGSGSFTLTYNNFSYNFPLEFSLNGIDYTYINDFNFGFTLSSIPTNGSFEYFIRDDCGQVMTLTHFFQMYSSIMPTMPFICYDNEEYISLPNPYGVEWNNEDIDGYYFVLVTQENPIDGLAPGYYFNNHSSSGNFTANYTTICNPILQPYNINIDAPIDNILLTGGVNTFQVCEANPFTLSVDNPLNGATYSWKLNDVLINGQNGTSITNNILGIGTPNAFYTVIQSYSGCVSQATIEVLNAIPIISAGEDISGCTNFISALSPTPISLGNGIIGQWSCADNNVSFNSPNNPNTGVSFTTTGEYTITWTLFNGNCTKQDQLQASVIVPPPSPPMYNGVTNINCTTYVLGSPSNIENYSFQWYNFDNTESIGLLNQSIAVTSPGVYTLRMFPINHEDCYTSSIITVTGSTTPPDASISLLTPASGATCPVLTASLDGGVPGTSYVWSLDGTSIPNSNLPTISINATGLYSCTIASQGGCNSTASLDPQLTSLFPTAAGMSLYISTSTINNTTWGNPDGTPFTVYVNGQIIVNASQSLTILPNTTVVFLTTTSGIILELGADLIADGGSNAVTPTINFVPLSCNSYWKGIHQKGRLFNTATTWDESRLVLKNCNIHNAVCGVNNMTDFKPFTPSVSKSFGSMVIEFCNFINCKRSIVASTCKLKWTLADFTRIKNNNFNHTADYTVLETGYGDYTTLGAVDLQSEIYKHPFVDITLYQYLYKDAITNCSFNQSINTSSPVGVGIWVQNTPALIGNFTSNSTVQGDPTLKNIFNNLYIGVMAPTIGGLGAVNVLANEFYNTRYGVTLKNQLNADIVDNRFEFFNIGYYSPNVNNTPSYSISSQYGVSNEGGEGVRINGNGFINTYGNTTATYGIRCRSTKATGALNTIRDNFFNQQFYAAQQYEAGNTNMTINCNQMPGYNRNDWAITSGELIDQGSCFDAPSSLTEQFHIPQSGFINRNIYMSTTNNNGLIVSSFNSTIMPSPSAVTSNVTLVDCFFPITDFSTICSDWRTRIPKQTLWAFWDNAQEIGKDMEDGIPSLELIAAELVRWASLDGTIDTAIVYMDSLDHDIGRRMLVPTYISIQDSTAAIETLAAITYDSPENIAFHDYWDDMVDFVLEADGTGKAEEAASRLATIATDKFNPYHSIYPTYLDIKSNQIRIIEPELEEEIIFNPLNMNYELTISPNPGTGYYNISWKSFSNQADEDYTLTVYNQFGIAVHTIAGISEQQSLIHLGSLPSGIYYVIVSSAHQQFMGKIIHLPK